MKDFGQFIFVYRVKGLPAITQFFKSFESGLRHLFVRLLGAANDMKLLRLSDALVSVLVIQSESKQKSLFLFIVVHLGKVSVNLPGFQVRSLDCWQSKFRQKKTPARH